MSYKGLKWLILWIPTITIGLWEYVRHTSLLPYISMELGNLLAPVFVFLVTLTLLRSLFGRLEAMQESLQHQRVVKAAFEEREQLARELHDGISQSLFMLSVKLDKLERSQNDVAAKQLTEQIRQTVRHVYDDVRQSIANLHDAPSVADQSWMQSIHHLTEEMEHTSGVLTKVEWLLPDDRLTPKQKVELLAIIREALMNAQKHAQASSILIRCISLASHEQDRKRTKADFKCWIEDDGIGCSQEQLHTRGKYGVQMMRDRAAAMGWDLQIRASELGGTLIEIVGGREDD